MTLQTSDIVPGLHAGRDALRAAGQGGRRQRRRSRRSRRTRTSTRRSCTRRSTSRSRTGRRARWPRSTASRWTPTRPGTRPTSRTRRSTRWCARPPARRTVDEATAAWLKVQKIQYERGGYIGWANQNIVDAAVDEGARHEAERVLQPRRLQLPRRLARSQYAPDELDGGRRAGGPCRARAAARNPIARFVLRRIAAAVATLLVVSMLVFAGTEVLPGDAASRRAGQDGDAGAGRRAARPRWGSTARSRCATSTGSAGFAQRRPRQLGRRLRGGRGAADLEPGAPAPRATRSGSRSSPRCSMIPLSLRARRRRGAARGPARRRTRSRSARSRSSRCRSS